MGKREGEGEKRACLIQQRGSNFAIFFTLVEKEGRNDDRGIFLSFFGGGGGVVDPICERFKYLFIYAYIYSDDEERGAGGKVLQNSTWNEWKLAQIERNESLRFLSLSINYITFPFSYSRFILDWLLILHVCTCMYVLYSTIYIYIQTIPISFFFCFPSSLPPPLLPQKT